MMKIKQILKSRNQLPEKILLGKDTTIRSGISTGSQKFAADGNPPLIFAPYTIFKGKAACDISPILPKFSKTPGGNHIMVERRGVMLMRFWPAIGERKYDWEKRQAFALSVTELGSLINLAPKDSCEFFHDPSMLSSNAGQVRKSLSIKPPPDGNGYFISLTVVNNIQKTNERFVVPVTSAEFSVMRTAFSFALPRIMGWDKYTNQHPKTTDGNSSKLIPLLEWEK